MNTTAGKAGGGRQFGFWYWPMITGLTVCLLCLTLWPDAGGPSPWTEDDVAEVPVQGTLAVTTP